MPTSTAAATASKPTRESHTRWRSMALALALALALAQCVSLCSALPDMSGGCGFDSFEEDSAPLPVTVTRRASRRSRGTFQVQAMSDEARWEPLRIVAFLQGVSKKSIMCNDDMNAHNITNIFGQSVACITQDGMQKYSNRMFNKMLRAAVKLHTERLLVERAEEPIAVPSLVSSDVCKAFSVPGNHRSTGVSDADMVLYATPVPMKRTAPLVQETCAVNEQGRPTVGVVAFDLLSFVDYGLHRASVRFLAHAIAHTLGFSYSVMKEKGMIQLQEIRGHRDAPIMTSQNVKQAAQKHYGCSSLDGMEMKSKKGLESHWKRRNALDELMSLPLPRQGDSFIGLYTELTLSAFQDLGYYKANFQMAESMKWGKDAGCDFMTFVCKDSTENKFPAMFCDPTAGRDVYKCSSDRASFGVCSSNPALTVDALWTEFCPITKAITRCDKRPHAEMPGHRITANSWCLDAQSLSVADSEAEGAVGLDGVCAEVKCDNGEVSVRYAGGSGFIPCSAGASIQVSSDFFQGGSILCPKYEEVCTVGPRGESLLSKRN